MNRLRSFLKESIITRRIPDNLKSDAKAIIDTYRKNQYCAIMPIMINNDIAIIGKIKFDEICSNNGSKFRIIYVDRGVLRNVTLHKREQKIILKNFNKK